jgi:hypothetical protein
MKDTLITNVENNSGSIVNWNTAVAMFIQIGIASAACFNGYG